MVFSQKGIDSCVALFAGAGMPLNDARTLVDVAHHAAQEATAAIHRVIATLGDNDAPLALDGTDKLVTALMLALRMTQTACDSEIEAVEKMIEKGSL